ncbi:hypothetical protein L6452_27151 [Arctium lappa]|uniref:Uncharacterized protein n=1 Tax=Arctium lappa TaxID=4217 RepID=A0ACB9A082_ARCLA|nr:hypothetical protein L6452_27151 [Arctium lappa]
MVSTRGRPHTRVDGVEATTSTTDQSGRAEVVVRPSVQPDLGGGPEVIPQVDMASSHPVIRDANSQSKLMANMMLVMNEVMAKQQEFLLKVIEDRDVSNQRNETIAENIEVIGSGGTGHVIRTEEPITTEARPPEFSGSEDPVACIKWIQGIEQAFGLSECGDDQKLSSAKFKKKVMEEYCSERALDRIEAEFRALEKGNLMVRKYTRQFMEKLGLVGQVAPTEKKKIKAYLKGLSVDMMSMVRNSKASNLRETIEDAQFMEEVYARGKPEKAVVVGDKRKWESKSIPPRRTRTFVENRSFNSNQEARWCRRCHNKHHGNCNPTPQPCNKCGKSDHATKDCPIRGLICFECKALEHMKRDCPKLKSGSATEKRENPLGFWVELFR